MDDSNSDLLADCDNDLYDILPNPDKCDDIDPDSMFINPVSDYYNPPQLNELRGQLGKGLTFLHCNIRGLYYQKISHS